VSNLLLDASVVARDQARTSIIVYGEVVETLLGVPSRARLEPIFEAFLVRVPPVPITRAEMDRYAALRRALRPPHGPGLIGDIDTLIAATAIEHGMTLVSMDRDFERVPGLDLLLIPRR
jgi:predicted nucleic acid-binding protein